MFSESSFYNMTLQRKNGMRREGKTGVTYCIMIGLDEGMDGQVVGSVDRTGLWLMDRNGME